MSENSRMKVEEVRVSGNNDAVVTFKDGHQMTFYGNNFERGVLRRSVLTINNNVVFNMIGRAGDAPHLNDHKIQTIDSRYSQKQVAKYWQAAIEYIEREYPANNRILQLPKILICNFGRRDYELLQNGTADMLGA